MSIAHAQYFKSLKSLFHKSRPLVVRNPKIKILMDTVDQNMFLVNYFFPLTDRGKSHYYFYKCQQVSCSDTALLPRPPLSLSLSNILLTPNYIL